MGAGSRLISQLLVVLPSPPLQPQAYTMGLTLTTAVPQTLGIGISLVRSCGGNEGLALMLTSELMGGAAAPQRVGSACRRRMCLATSNGELVWSQTLAHVPHECAVLHCLL